MRTRLHYSFIVLAWFVGVHSALAQVTNLGIAPAGGQFIIYWPVGATNYVLQTVPNLASTNWLTARTAFAVNTAGNGNGVGTKLLHFQSNLGLNIAARRDHNAPWFMSTIAGRASGIESPRRCDRR